MVGSDRLNVYGAPTGPSMVLHGGPNLESMMAYGVLTRHHLYDPNCSLRSVSLVFSIGLIVK